MINEIQEITKEFVNSGSWVEDMEGNKFFSQESVEAVIKQSYEMGKISCIMEYERGLSAKTIALEDMKEFGDLDMSDDAYDDQINYSDQL